MCLSIIVDHPDLEIESGQIGAFEYAITSNGMGYRCGYLKVEPGHPWHGRCPEDLDGQVEVHGGVTFLEPDKPCGKEGADAGWWIGFDCAHSGDRPDPTLPGCIEPSYIHGSIKTTEYVLIELQNLARQAAVSSIANMHSQTGGLH